MVNELSYNTISLVVDSWEQMKRDDKMEKAGSLLFQHPATKVLFGFPIEIDPTSKTLLNSRRFKIQAQYMMDMLETALQMLGPDIELLSEVLHELGVKHQRYGVKPVMFELMGESLIQMLEQVLDEKDFTYATRVAWEETYQELSRDMIDAQKKR